jgi:hypothetical protein
LGTLTSGQINETVAGAARYDREYVTPAEMKLNGWTDKAIEKFLGKPDKVAPNPRYRSAANMRLYKVDRVEQAEASPEFQGWQQSRSAQKSKSESCESAKEKRFQKFSAKYESWQAALPDACNHLFNLNRYAKRKSCSASHKRDIYLVKDDLIRLLYQLGYCDECYRHTYELAGQICHRCYGAGSDRSGQKCGRCRGYGCRPTRTACLVVFHFIVNKKPFTWHQPEEKVPFSFLVTQPGSAWKPSDGEKEVSLSKNKFAEAKDLISWIIPQMEKDVPPSAVEPSQTPTDSQDLDISIWEECYLSQENCQGQCGCRRRKLSIQVAEQRTSVLTVTSARSKENTTMPYASPLSSRPLRIV